MADREKVIKGLQCCKSPNDHEHCPYNTGVHYNVCTYRLLSDAVELLKEQEPIEPKTGKWITRLRHEHYPSGKPYEEDFCSECGKRGSLEYPFCPWCGIKMGSGEVG